MIPHRSSIGETGCHCPTRSGSPRSRCRYPVLDGGVGDIKIHSNTVPPIRFVILQHCNTNSKTQCNSIKNPIRSASASVWFWVRCCSGFIRLDGRYRPQGLLSNVRTADICSFRVLRVVTQSRRTWRNRSRSHGSLRRVNSFRQRKCEHSRGSAYRSSAARLPRSDSGT